MSELWRRRMVLVGIFALGVIVRLAGIRSRPLWYDEAFAVLFSEKGLGLMLRGTIQATSGSAVDVHPLAYYTLLHYWMRILGESPQAVRCLSVLIGLIVVLLVYLLSRLLFGARAAPALTFWVAISPFQVHYSQEVRMYVLLTMFCLLGVYAFWNGYRTGAPSWWIVFAVSAAAAQYTHNLAGFFFLSLAFIPLLRRNWRAARETLFTGVFALLLYLPWLWYLWRQFERVRQSYWTLRPGIDRIFTTLLSFVTNLPVPRPWLPVALFISLFVTVLAGWQTWKAWRGGGEHACLGVWLAYLALVPPAMLFLFSQWQPVYIERALLPSGVFFLLWVGWSLYGTGLPRGVRWPAQISLVLGMVLGLWIHVTYRGFPYAPYPELAASLGERVAEGEVILHSNKLSFYPLAYYDRGLAQEYLADLASSGADTLAPATQEVLRYLAAPSVESAVGNAGRVWFLIFDRAIAEYQSLGYATHPHLAWLDSHYQLDHVESWGDLWLYVYSR